MVDRREQRVDLLLTARQQEEQAARRAFQEVLAEAEAAAKRLVALDAQLASQSRAARTDLLGGRYVGEAYRASAAELRREIGRGRGELRRIDKALDQRRQELSGAMRRRRAAELLRDRLVARRSAWRRQAEARLLDDQHAARVTGRPEAGRL
ncbi:MAG TPA: hypothetical protein VM695_05685 [Phycisphaerae bacterium]|nr:hypothetical protein [Phycisphaerae bacterium]